MKVIAPEELLAILPEAPVPRNWQSPVNEYDKGPRMLIGPVELTVNDPAPALNVMPFAVLDPRVMPPVLPFEEMLTTEPAAKLEVAGDVPLMVTADVVLGADTVKAPPAVLLMLPLRLIVPCKAVAEKAPLEPSVRVPGILIAAEPTAFLAVIETLPVLDVEKVVDVSAVENDPFEVALATKTEAPGELLEKLPGDVPKAILPPALTKREVPVKVEAFVRSALKVVVVPEAMVRGFAELLVTVPARVID